MEHHLTTKRNISKIPYTYNAVSKTACQCEIPRTKEHRAPEGIAEGAKNCAQCALS